MGTPSVDMLTNKSNAAGWVLALFTLVLLLALGELDLLLVLLPISLLLGYGMARIRRQEN